MARRRKRCHWYPAALRLADGGGVVSGPDGRAVECELDNWHPHHEVALCVDEGGHWCWRFGRPESRLADAPAVWLLQRVVDGLWTPAPEDAGPDARVLRSRADARAAAGCREPVSESLL